MVKIDKTIIAKIKAYKNAMNRQFPVSRIFLFGSYAKGKQRPGSDIDICLVLKKEISAAKIFNKSAFAIAQTDLRFEPVFYTEADMSDHPSFGLLREIKETGIEVR